MSSPSLWFNGTKQLGRGSLISPFPTSRETPSAYFLKFCHFLHKLCASLHALYFHSSACSHKLVVIRILKITKVGQGESPCDLQTYLLTFPSEYKTTMTFMSFSTLHLCGFFFFFWCCSPTTCYSFPEFHLKSTSEMKEFLPCRSSLKYT